MKRFAIVLIALVAALPAGATSEGPAEALAAASARIEAAVAALGDAAPGDARVAALAEAMAAHEAALGDLRGAVIGSEERERELAFALQRRRDETTRLLATLQALSRTPAGVRGLHPSGPLGAARAASTLATLTPKLQAEADALAARLEEIEAVRALRAKSLAELTGGLDELAAARTALVGALARREPAPDGPAALVPAALLRDAGTLSELADRLAALGPDAAPPAEVAAGAPMALRWPVAGRVLRGFREPDAAGVRRPGLVVEAAPLALVRAPADARVRYAGPFLDYGYVAVLEPRADVLIVLAGLASLDARTGAVVRAGAPLGLLGGRQLDTQEYLMLGEAGTRETPGETLYIELRHGEGPVDPAAWFGERNG